MSKNKLAKFAEMADFKNVVQPDDVSFDRTPYILRGKWNDDFFHNNNPITLELGCGKGEYTVGLAQNCSTGNFIGVDIKGARIWRGAKEALEQNLGNVGFLRTKIDLIDKFFSENEVSEIWVTFADPQPKKQNKRLTSAFFLNLYRKICVDGARIHLKTDSRLLHFYTRALLDANGIIPDFATDDLYASGYKGVAADIQTFYEKIFLAEGKKITYLNFKLAKDRQIVEIPKFVENL
ncbi:MAG: tRNA (guanosine(46)-N7)-methyltransferase TrmB [Bacteroidales bacterium]|nr:tRNA (guanosine(46)-N7)-methyltransferase TrmB [Bacteroidales bacterium]